MRELARRSEQELAVAVQQCYRHVFYPSRDRLPGSGTDLAHTAIDVPSSADKPGTGQQQVVRVLRELHKLRLPGDDPDSPTYIRDRTPLKSRGQMTTAALRDEFRRNPALPMLVGDDVFVSGIRQGVESGVYVYRSGQLLYGPDDPHTEIRVDEQSSVFTMGYAKRKGVWPRAPEPEPSAGNDEDEDGGGDKPVTVEKDEKDDTEKPPRELNAEGVLREALVRVWEQADGHGAKRIASLDVRLFNAEDGLRLMGPAGSVSGAEKTVHMTGGYDTGDGGSFILEFSGSVADAEPIREFLQPQLRAARGVSLEVRYTLRFNDGLPLERGQREKFADRLSRFASGAARVSATVMPED